MYCDDCLVILYCIITLHLAECHFVYRCLYLLLTLLTVLIKTVLITTLPNFVFRYQV